MRVSHSQCFSKLFLEVEYDKISRVLSALFHDLPVPGLQKTAAKELLSLAQSDREHALLRYTMVMVAGMTASQARKQYGFQNLSSLSTILQENIKDVCRIQKAVDELALTQDKVLLLSHGICPEGKDMSTSEGSCSADSDEEFIIPASTSQFSHYLPILPSTVNMCLIRSNYNWFEVAECVRGRQAET